MTFLILSILTGIFALITILGYSKLVWWFTILDFFRLQYAAIATILIFLTVFFAFYPLAIINLVVAGFNLYRIRHFFPRKPHKPTQDCNKTIFSVNAYKDNSDPEELRKIIKITDPKILLILEMTEHLEKKLINEFSNYAYRLQTPVRDGFSICLMSKVPLIDTKITFHGKSDTPLMHATAKINGKDYQLYSAHPKPALNKEWSIERHSYFAEIEEIIADKKDLPIIIMGDFNSVPWEKHFTQFLKKTNLKSTIKDQGYKVTWPVYFPLMGIPMDHILISPDQTYSNLQVGPYVGSDHFPLSINL